MKRLAVLNEIIMKSVNQEWIPDRWPSKDGKPKIRLTARAKELGLNTEYYIITDDNLLEGL